MRTAFETGPTVIGPAFSSPERDAPPDASEAPAVTDPDAFRAFYAQMLPVVYGFLYARLGGDRELTNDLTQDTFLAAVREVRRGVRVTSPQAWLLGIARHKLLDHFRRERRRGPALVLVEDVPDVPAAEIDAEARERARAALALVPAPQRVALILRHLDGFSPPEVAAVLGRSLHATESLLARGRESFRRAYGQVSGD